MTKEHRRALRVVHIAPACFKIDGQILDGESRNVSRGGIELRVGRPEGTEHRLTLLAKGLLSFYLPHYPSPIRIHADVRWYREHEFIRCGLRFSTELSSTALLILREMERKELLGMGA